MNCYSLIRIKLCVGYLRINSRIKILFLQVVSNTENLKEIQASTKRNLAKYMSLSIIQYDNNERHIV